MKSFFRSQLSKLHLIGIRQVDYLSKEDIEILLDELVKITKKFSYIPEPRQMAEIEKQLVEDLDAKDGLTLRNLWKWMYKISPLYGNATRISEEDLTPKVDAPILEGEERDYWLDKWRESLNQMQSNLTQAGKGGGSRLKESLGIEKAQSVGVIKNYEIGEICDQCGGTGHAGPSPEEQFDCTHCDGTGLLNIVAIPASSEEEAKKTYASTFGSLRDTIDGLKRDFLGGS